MNLNSSQTYYERRWWRVWYGFVVMALLWLAWCGWLARAPEPWANGWVGWWTGDRMASQPLWSFHTDLRPGAEVVPDEGNPAYRVQLNSAVNLGHWREKRNQFTWSGWVRLASTNRGWPAPFVVVREAVMPQSTFAIGFEDGHPKVVLEKRHGRSDLPPAQTISVMARSAAPVEPGRWTHLAFSTDGELLRLTVNGRPVAEVMARHAPIFLAALTLRHHPPEGTAPQAVQGCVIEQDDVVLYDRVVPPEELAALAARGRGAWAAEMERPLQAARWWSVGWPLALLGLAWLILLKLLPNAPDYVARGRAIATQSAYRAVRWTWCVGWALTLLLTALLARRAEREDARLFAQSLHHLQQEIDASWERLADLLSHAKDWIAVQPELTSAAWDTWLAANQFPQDFPGVVGVGYAQQVLPGGLPAHEAVWSARHGFAYRVHPGLETERCAVRELEGEPRLPVVLYETRLFNRRLWASNDTILGRDLLFQAKDDPRPWAAARRVEEVAARNEVQTSSLEEIAPAGWFGKPLHGLELYVPWTLRMKPVEGPDSPLESAAWKGVAFASADPVRLVREFLGTNDSLIGFRLYTGGLGGEKHDLIADTGDLQPDTAERPHAVRRGTLSIPFFYRRLHVEAWTTPAFEAQSMRRWPWMAGAAGVALTLLTAGLLFVQVRAREEQGRVLDALREANAGLLQAYQERENLSRDLHDGSIQNLYALGLHLQRVQVLLETQPGRARTELTDSLSLLDQSIAELRQFILNAGVDHLPNLTVSEALQGLVDRLRKSTGTDFDLRVDAAAAELPAQTGVQLLNLVREAISNALRHARARLIQVHLERVTGEPGQSPQWRLQITDDGRGFEVREVNGKGRGLMNLASRAAELGGRCDIQSTPGRGTRVVIEFPA